ncbi:MAG TPA: phosphocholine cytidylyltransferase family protein [Blastocatellia bacterium]
MKGIILAAGKGLRLNGVAGATPKCLMEIGGITLIERQIQAFKASGIDDLAVVVGFEAGRVRDACGPEIRFVENTRFDETNSLYSLWLARDLLLDGFIVMNSDVLFHPQLLSDLITARYEDALLVAYSGSLSGQLGDEEMKVKVRGGCVIDISKTIDPLDADGENVGVVKFGPSGARLVVEYMDALVAKGSRRDWAPRAFLSFAQERPLHAIDTRGYPWIEIDFPEDYNRAVNEVLPEISRITGGFEELPSQAASTSLATSRSTIV